MICLLELCKLSAGYTNNVVSLHICQLSSRHWLELHFWFKSYSSLTGVFCLFVELHWEGSATFNDTPSSCSFAVVILFGFKIMVFSQNDIEYNPPLVMEPQNCSQFSAFINIQFGRQRTLIILRITSRLILPCCITFSIWREVRPSAWTLKSFCQKKLGRKYALPCPALPDFMIIMRNNLQSSNVTKLF